MLLNDLDRYFKALLNTESFASADPSLNGLQVGRRNQEITKCAFAVDACQTSIEQAAQAGADLLFVHHGLFWGKPLALTGSHYRRIQALLDSDLALYACHLPLDAHPSLGNNARLAALLGLQNSEPFGLYKGKLIGCRGTLPHPLPVEGLLAALSLTKDDCLSVLPFGPELIETVGIVSGGAAETVSEAIHEGLHLFLTGDSSHEVYHSCFENRIHFIAAGHYFTETFGVRAVAKQLEAELGLQTLFLPVPTHL